MTLARRLAQIWMPKDALSPQICEYTLFLRTVIHTFPIRYENVVLDM